jgi:XTP/dITP diphosphohydrolase
MIRRLVVASKNPDKIAEIESVLESVGLDIEIVRGLEWSDVEEIGETLKENALLKARAVATATGLPSVADDTGLEVRALDGAPGVRTGRYAGPGATYDDNVARLLRELDGVGERQATFRTVVALVNPAGGEIVTEGLLEGQIAYTPRGEFGFGYDPVFEVGGRTLAEMTMTDKNDVSHRARALRSLCERLQSSPRETD